MVTQVNEMVSLMYTAKRPWSNGDGAIEYSRITHRTTARSTMAFFQDSDTQEQIDKCLSCTLLTCTNCIESGERRTVYALKKVLPGQKSLFEMEG